MQIRRSSTLNPDELVKCLSGLKEQYLKDKQNLFNKTDIKS